MKYTCSKVPSWVHITSLILISVTGVVFLIGFFIFIDVHSYAYTKCYPISYHAELGVCWEEMPGGFYFPADKGPYPVKGWINFAFYDPKSKTNQTELIQLVCGNTLQGAIAKAEKHFPLLEPIPCGLKSYLDNPEQITFFKDGIPSDQLLWVIITASILGAVFGFYSFIFLIQNCKRTKYNPLIQT